MKMSEENNMKLNRLALASFVLGTISVLTQLLFIFFHSIFRRFNFISYATAPIAIIVGIIALYQISRGNRNQRSKRFAQVGIILGVVDIFLSICFVIVIFIIALKGGLLT
jgi:hypothetical protein